MLEFYAAVNDLTTNLHLNDNDDDVKDDIDNDVGRMQIERAGGSCRL